MTSSTSKDETSQQKPDESSNDSKQKNVPDYSKDMVLRKVERDTLIPRRMEHKITTELCKASFEAYNECVASAGLLVPIRCKQQFNDYKECSNKWMRDENFRIECTEEYLALRRRYRKYGIAEPSPYRRYGKKLNSEDKLVDKND